MLMTSTSKPSGNEVLGICSIIRFILKCNLMQLSIIFESIIGQSPLFSQQF